MSGSGTSSQGLSVACEGHYSSVALSASAEPHGTILFTMELIQLTRFGLASPQTKLKHIIIIHVRPYWPTFALTLSKKLKRVKCYNFLYPGRVKMVWVSGFRRISFCTEESCRGGRDG